jgi:cobalt-zinc-cadmium efflux system protein
MGESQEQSGDAGRSPEPGQHNNDHSHDDHSHDDHRGRHDHFEHHRLPADADRRWLSAALGLIAVFMVVEVAVGVTASSLALLSDAAHMLTDVGALALALVAMRLAARPPRGGFTYGLKRAEILSAQANGLALIVLGAWVGYEAVRRLISPPPTAGLPVLVMALIGVGVNLVATGFIRRASHRSLNLEGAYLHLITDLAAFAATAVAGVLILTTGFRRADPIASLIVVVLMLRAGASLLRASLRVLLEAAPAGMDPAQVGRDLADHRGVVEVHDLHVWEITSGSPALSAHVIVDSALDCHLLRLDLEALLLRRYGLRHTTLQVDHAQPRLHHIGRG